jgi:2-phosphoglycerate kinase
MIYLIGGPPKCGKTTLAKKLSKTFGMPWVSTDTLQCVIKPYTNKESFLPSKNNDEKYARYSSAEIIEDYQRQAKTVYQAIEMFAVCEITDGNDFIIEGYHVEPELVAELNSKYPGKIKSVFLIKYDREKFVGDIKKSTTPNDWIIARTNNEETYQKIAEMICEYGKFFENEAKKYSFKVLNMDDDFDDRIKEAVDHLIPLPPSVIPSQRGISLATP